MSYYPIHLNLRDRLCVVIGAGKVAERRILSLVQSGGDVHVRVVAPEASSIVQQLAGNGRVTWIDEAYRAEHIDDAFLVVVATNDREVNRTACSDAQERNVLLSVADAPDEGNFITPSIVRQGDFILTVSTSGRSPTLAAVATEDLEWEYGPQWDGFTRLMGELRDVLKQVHKTEEARKAAVRRVIGNDRVRDAVMRGDLAEAEALARQCL